MNKVIVRPYIKTDCNALTKIYYNTIHNINIKDYNEEQVNAWAPESSLQGEGWSKKWEKSPPWVALIDDQIVGFTEFENSGHIDCFYCHHQYQGKGVGKALMKHIKNIANDNGISRIWAEVSITAKSFFERQEFEVVKKQTVNLRGVELVNFVMECNLNDAR